MTIAGETKIATVEMLKEAREKIGRADTKAGLIVAATGLAASAACPRTGNARKVTGMAYWGHVVRSDSVEELAEGLSSTPIDKRGPLSRPALAQQPRPSSQVSCNPDQHLDSDSLCRLLRRHWTRSPVGCERMRSVDLMTVGGWRNALRRRWSGSAWSDGRIAWRRTGAASQPAKQSIAAHAGGAGGPFCSPMLKPVVGGGGAIRCG